MKKAFTRIMRWFGAINEARARQAEPLEQQLEEALGKLIEEAKRLGLEAGICALHEQRQAFQERARTALTLCVQRSTGKLSPALAQLEQELTDLLGRLSQASGGDGANGQPSGPVVDAASWCFRWRSAVGWLLSFGLSGALLEVAGLPLGLAGWVALGLGATLLALGPWSLADGARQATARLGDALDRLRFRRELRAMHRRISQLREQIQIAHVHAALVEIHNKRVMSEFDVQYLRGQRAAQINARESDGAAWSGMHGATSERFHNAAEKETENAFRS